MLEFVLEWFSLHLEILILKLGASATVNGFCEWAQVGIDVYILQIPVEA